MLRAILIVLLYPSLALFNVQTSAQEKQKETAQADAKHSHQHAHHDDEASDEDDEHDHGEQEDSTLIDVQVAQQAGIGLAVAGAGSIERHVQVYGRLVTPPTHQVLVRARFSGLVVSLHANTGDAVKKGDLLAVVESNESLRGYEIRAAINGVVQERLINAGESTTDAPLFVLVNQEQLWAELRIFPSQRAAIKPKQPVHIRHNGHDHHAEIMSLVPPATAQPYVVARVALANEHQDMAAGDYVLADIDVELIEAKVRIENRALQEVEGQWVVFVRESTNGSDLNQSERYRAAPVTLGVRDDRYVEVLSGLDVDAEYVVQNSYLIKADLGKRAAEHEH